MALSDYLTGDEWDACFYGMCTFSKAGDFGTSMKNTIQELLKRGHKFSGLDEEGNKRTQIKSGKSTFTFTGDPSNAKKILIFLGNPDRINVLDILDNGRNFLKKHYPDLVCETDEQWNEIHKN